jgi:hypothetical protein
MVAKPKPEDKWMLLLFPMITLGLFLTAIVLFQYLPMLLQYVSKWIPWHP